MTIELTQDDYDSLLVLIGYATGAAYQHGNLAMARRFLALANRINKDNPAWIPYDIPATA
jgi:hypothetical protein